jgi:hypothetical protein
VRENTAISTGTPPRHCSARYSRNDRSGRFIDNEGLIYSDKTTRRAESMTERVACVSTRAAAEIVRARTAPLVFHNTLTVYLVRGIFIIRHRLRGWEIPIPVFMSVTRTHTNAS